MTNESQTLNCEKVASSKRTKIKTKWHEIKRIFFEWSERAPFDCYPKIFKSKHKSLSIIWLIIFVLFASLTIFVLYRSIREFFCRETVTKIGIKHERPLLFPTVTVCDADPFTSKKSQEIFRQTALDEYGVDLDNMTFMDAISTTAHTTEIIKMRAASFTREQKQSLGFGINQIYDIQFDGVSSEPKSNLGWFYSFDYGNCFQFNSGQDFNGNKIDIRETSIQV
jgi:hypothetical protein